MSCVQIYFYSSRCFSALQKAKRLQSQKQEGNEAFTGGNYQKAFDIYTEALTIDPRNKSTNAKLYYNRALVSSKVCCIVFRQNLLTLKSCQLIIIIIIIIINY